MHLRLTAAFASFDVSLLVFLHSSSFHLLLVLLPFIWEFLCFNVERLAEDSLDSGMTIAPEIHSNVIGCQAVLSFDAVSSSTPVFVYVFSVRTSIQSIYYRTVYHLDIFYFHFQMMEHYTLHIQ